jgi:mannose-6-phosphate isomerase-like protein (cupin superfamily)
VPPPGQGGELLAEGQVLDHQMASRAHGREERRQEGCAETEHRAGENPDPGRNRQWFQPGRSIGATQVTAWGMNVIEIDSGCATYPEHDHLKDGQEEVYLVLRGSATLRSCGRDYLLETGAMIRVPPSERRKITPGPQCATVLALGATPGKAYEPRR